MTYSREYDVLPRDGQRRMTAGCPCDVAVDERVEGVLGGLLGRRRVYRSQQPPTGTDTIPPYNWAVAQRQGHVVINYSGDGGAYAPMNEAVQHATAAGVPAVVAAANDRTDAWEASPARAPARSHRRRDAVGGRPPRRSRTTGRASIWSHGDGRPVEHREQDTSSDYSSGAVDGRSPCGGRRPPRADLPVRDAQAGHDRAAVRRDAGRGPMHGPSTTDCSIKQSCWSPSPRLPIENPHPERC